jgi:hypothetical protein
METLVEIADESPPKRLRYDKEDEELLEKINSQEVTEMTFKDCLTQHVEQVRKVHDIFLLCDLLSVVMYLRTFCCKLRLHD